MVQIARKGILFILAGPTASGKTTVGEYLLGHFDNLSLSVSSTTRDPREGEVDGVSYNFTTREEFERGIREGVFFEWEEVHGNLYGTLMQALEDAIEGGRDLFLAIDINGALKVKKAFPRNVVLSFILPPSAEVMIERVKKRGFVSEEELSKRLITARSEYRLLLDIARDPSKVDYIVINDELHDTCYTAKAIVEAERKRIHRLDYDALRDLCRIDQ